MTTTLARRRLLAGALAGAGVAAAALTGCELRLSDDGPGVPAADPDPLEPLLAAELALLASYDAAIAGFPALAARLRPLRADHAAHAQALRARMDPRRVTAMPSSAPPSPAVPADQQGAVAALAAAERAAAARAGAACLTAAGERAALLASIAACESSHMVVIA